ncbi:MAG: hypothetical protein ACLFRY_03070 [Spirochaetia bacterium]
MWRKWYGAAPVTGFLGVLGLFLILAGCPDPADTISSGSSLEGSITIAEGADKTETADVELKIYSDTAVRMRFSNDGESWSDWFDYTETYRWTLEEGNGTKTVYVELEDQHGEIQRMSDIIILDAPLAGSVSFTVEDGAAAVNSFNVTLHIETTGIVRMRFSNDKTVWSPWLEPSTTCPWELEPGGGYKTVYGQFEDEKGEIISAEDGINLNVVGPTASFGIEGTAAYTKTAKVNLVITGEAITEMRFKNGNGEWSDWTAFESPKLWNLPSGDGTKMVYGQFKNEAGGITETGDGIILDETKPVVNKFVINNDAAYANKREVVLNCSVSDAMGGPIEARIWNSQINPMDDWVDYESNVSWTLPAGVGSKTVCAEFRDPAGNTVYREDSIILDDKPPVLTSFKINNGAQSTNSDYVTLYNNVSGASKMRFRNSGGNWGHYDYESTKSWRLSAGDGPKRVYAEFEDDAGNTISANADILLDEYRRLKVTIEKIDVIEDSDYGNAEIYWDFSINKHEDIFWGDQITITSRPESNPLSWSDDWDPILINIAAEISIKRGSGNFLNLSGGVYESDRGDDEKAELPYINYYYDTWGLGAHQKTLGSGDFKVKLYWKIEKIH